jgi:hypothetical protein
MLLRGPLAAEIGLCRTTVGPSAAVQGAANAIIIQICTGGDDLRLDRKVAGPFHLAEIRRPARSHQSFQLALLFGAHDLDLEITAAGGAPNVVSRSASCQGARVSTGNDRQAAGWGWQRSNHPAPALHDQKALATEATSLLRPVRPARRRSGKAVRGTFRPGALHSQEPAGYVEHGVDVQLPFVFPKIVKGDPLGVTNEPGGLVIQGGGALFQGAYP